MRSFLAYLMITVLLIVGTTAVAVAQGKPDYFLSWVDCPTCPPGEDVVMFHVPDGTGSPFTNARTLTGVADATRVLNLRDSENNPVEGYLKENVKIAVWSGGVWVPCPDGSHPDEDSDDQGRMFWSEPLHAGGYCDDGDPRPIVMIKGIPLGNDPFVAGNSNTPDLNGDLVVNLMDVVLFSGDYFSGTDPFRSDFLYDGSVDQSDLVLMAASMGADCP